MPCGPVASLVDRSRAKMTQPLSPKGVIVVLSLVAFGARTMAAAGLINSRPKSPMARTQMSVTWDLTYDEAIAIADAYEPRA